MKLYNPFKRVGVSYIYEELIEIANEYGLVNDHEGNDRMDFCFQEHWDKDIFRVTIRKVCSAKGVYTLVPKKIQVAGLIKLRWGEYGEYCLSTGNYWERQNNQTMFLWDWNFYKKELKKKLDKISKQIREDTKLSKKIELHKERFKNVLLV